MVEVRRTEIFVHWLSQLADLRAKVKILARIDRLGLGHFGDAAPVGDGVSELRVHSGPGYRLYLVQRGAATVILLCGGNKATQARDIQAARRLAKEV